MKNQLLIQEVISQISQRFSPKIQDIKKVCPSTLALLVPYLAHTFTHPLPMDRPLIIYWRRSTSSASRAPEIPLHMSRDILCLLKLFRFVLHNLFIELYDVAYITRTVMLLMTADNADIGFKTCVCEPLQSQCLRILSIYLPIYVRLVHHGLVLIDRKTI